MPPAAFLEPSLPLGAPEPDSEPVIPLSHYKGTALKNVGRDYRTGRVIPHKRSEIVAKKVAVWVSGGYSLNDIAVMLNVRPGLVKMHYGKELEFGAAKVGMEMTGHIVKRAKKSDRMAIFFAKARMNWREGDGSLPPSSPFNIHIHM